MTRVRIAATMAGLPLLAGCVSTGGSGSGTEGSQVDAPRHQMADTAGDGGDIDGDDAGWSEGIATYNQSVPYGREVTERADGYRI